MDRKNEEAGQGHLDLLRLDAARAGEGTAEELAHLEECALCRGNVNRLHTLAASLRGRVPPAEHVPSRVDKAIIGEYRRRFAPAPKTYVFPIRRWLAPAMGTAAAAALVAYLSLPLLRDGKFSAPDHPAPGTAVPGKMEAGDEDSGKDVNSDGRVDILDAFRLAKMIEGRDPGAAGTDINGDGEVNRLDVDAVARRAVAL